MTIKPHVLKVSFHQRRMRRDDGNKRVGKIAQQLVFFVKKVRKTKIENFLMPVRNRIVI